MSFKTTNLTQLRRHDNDDDNNNEPYSIKQDNNIKYNEQQNTFKSKAIKHKLQKIKREGKMKNTA